MRTIEKRLERLEQVSANELVSLTILYDAATGTDLTECTNLPRNTVLVPYNGQAELAKHNVVAKVQPGLIQQLLA